MKQLLRKWFTFPLRHKPEVEVRYCGRASEFLLMTGERLVLPQGGNTLAQVLNSLRQRGVRWAYELDAQYVVCTLNGKAAVSTDVVEAGYRMEIFSRKSIFEP